MPCTLHDEHVLLGAVFEDHCGTEFVSRYEGAPEESYCSEGPFLADSSPDFRMLVSGEDALRFLLIATTADASHLQEPGKLTQTLVLDAKAQVIDCVVVARTGVDSYFIGAGWENREELGNWLSELGKIEDDDGKVFPKLSFVDLADDIVELSLIGNDAALIFSELSAPDADEVENGAFTEYLLDTVHCLVYRLGGTSDCLIRIYCPAKSAPALFRAFLSFPKLSACGMDALGDLLIQEGLPVLAGDEYLSVDAAGLRGLVSERRDFIGARALKDADS